MEGIEKRCRFSNGIFNVLPLFWGDRRMSCGALVRHQNPKHIPEYPKATWERKNKDDEEDEEKRGRVGREYKEKGRKATKAGSHTSFKVNVAETVDFKTSLNK